MKHPSIEAKLAKEQGYPAFMSPEHISLVLKREQKNIPIDKNTTEYKQKGKL